MNSFYKKIGIVIFIAILFVVVSLSDSTYSLFFNVDSGDLFNFNTGIVDLKIIEDKIISIDSALPVVDSVGMKQDPYELTIKNTGTVPYIFDLYMYGSSMDKTINEDYIKVMVDNKLPKTLGSLDNKLLNRIVLYPDNEINLDIRVWLDYHAPNSELGKEFSAKLVVRGESFYKTLDSSGANYPIMTYKMIPVYYDDTLNSYRVADRNNLDNSNAWYNYDNKEWANVVTFKDTDRKIFDITLNNNIYNNDILVDNDNLIVNGEVNLNINNISNKYITQLFNINFESNSEYVYIINNGTISFYYSYIDEKFVFKTKNNKVLSNNYKIDKDKFYVVGYSYDLNTVNFYVNGEKLSSHNIPGNIGNGNFILGGSNTNYILRGFYTYSRILNDLEIRNNFMDKNSYVNDGLISGYNSFTPMNYFEYYSNMGVGSLINNDYVDSYYVWIPRFKYKLWNGLGNMNNFNNMVDIVFERNLGSTGMISCDGFLCYSGNNKDNILSDKDNGLFYTHPAFNNGSNNLYGFWVSKYEITDLNGISSNYNKDVLYIDNLEKLYNNISTLGSNYHIIKNSEWGAISYLTYSKYGIDNLDYGINDSYVSGNNDLDSSTLNKYGVYDLNGSYPEIMLSYNTDNNSFNLFNVNSLDMELYFDNFMLGDATYEINSNKEFINNRFIIRGSRGIMNYDFISLDSDIKYSSRIVIK